MNIEIANRLVTLRKQYNLSQEELAARLGISRQAVSRWERAEASPDTDNLINLSKIYGVSIDSLLALGAEGEEDLAFHTNSQALENTTDSYIPETRAVDDIDDIKKLLHRIAPVYPVIVTIIFLLLGFLLDLWHPGWMVFLTIPVFYVLVR